MRSPLSERFERSAVGQVVISAGIVLVLAVCVAVAAFSAGRVPLWSTLLGAAALAGAYEYTYAAAPPEVTTTSVTSVTSLVMTAALGFLAVALSSPRAESAAPVRRQRAARAEENDSFDEMMERAK